MAIILKEYFNSTYSIADNGHSPLSLKEDMNSLSIVSKDSLMVDIEGIHVGPTRNFTYYTEQALRSSIRSWTNPYERPLILHHNEKDGNIVGRVLSVSYTNHNTRSKTGALLFTCNVSEDEAKKGIKDGRYKTVSIGAIAHDVRCSICGHIISESGECEHERGATYNGETCYWMVYEMEAKELSYVIVPSDVYAHNVKIYSPVDKNIKEGACKKVTDTIEIKEGVETIIVEDADKKEETKVVCSNDQDTVKEETVEKETVEKETKEESKDNEKEEETKEVTLNEVIAKLENKIEKLTAELKNAEELRKTAEDELIASNTQLKEFAVDQVLMLREQLGRPVLVKENLMSRSKDSLMDSIVDLKEEVGGVKLTKAIDVKESVETTEAVEVKATEKATDEIKTISKVVTESLLDDEKDSSVKKEDESEKKDLKNVKENVELSNTIYETTLERMSKFYNL